MTKKVFAIVGATASHKTYISYKIAKQLNLEIVSFDSKQFFRELKIGSSIPESYILDEVHHHFISNKTIFEYYSAGDYEKEALSKLNQIFLKYDKVIMVGGSGLYLNAVENGLEDYPNIDIAIRNKLNKAYSEYGLEYLQKRLLKVDKDYYNRVDLKNHRRIMRALEIYEVSKIPYSKFIGNKKEKRNFTIYKIGIKIDKSDLNLNIDKRVDNMMKKGLLEEVRGLVPHKHLNSLNTIGYKELFDYLEGKYSLEIAIEEIKKNTKKLAKKQLTWFKKDKYVKWFYHHQINKIIEFINGK